MREEIFDKLMTAQHGKVQRVAMHPNDVTELNDGNPVPHTTDTPTFYHQKGVTVLLDPTVEEGSIRVLKVENVSKSDIEGSDFTNLDTAYHNHLELFHKEKSGPPNTCPECGKPTWMEGDCLECRVKFCGKAIVNLRKQMDDHFHYIAPSSDGVPEMMTTIAQYEVINKHEALYAKMADGQHRYVMEGNTSPNNEDGSRSEIFTCPNCGAIETFKLEKNQGVDLPVVCTVCTPEEKDDLTSPGIGLGPPDEEGFQSFVTNHNHDDIGLHLNTCPGCRVEAGPTKQVISDIHELQIGDLIVRKSSTGGFDIFIIPPGPSDPKQELEFKCFFNEKGAFVLGDSIDEHFKKIPKPEEKECMSDGPGIRMPLPGEHVLYWDYDGQEYDALVIKITTHTPGDYPTLSLMFVDMEEVNPNGYGHLIRKNIEHESVVEVHRNCWT